MEKLQNEDLRQRLDVLLVSRGYFRSRDRAKAALLKGMVSVNGVVQRKAAKKVEVLAKIELKEQDFPYVGRAALKLKAALEHFNIAVMGKVAIDIGVATGGFSDLLLSKGASKVYGVDIGDGQIEPSILSNARFKYINHQDARDVKREQFGEDIEVIVVDVSFISIRTLLPALHRLTTINTVIIVLIKPQFELGPKSGELMKNKKVIQLELEKIKVAFEVEGFEVIAEMSSPVKGKEGTQEYLWMVKLN